MEQPLATGGRRPADVGFSRDNGRVLVAEVLGQVLGVARAVQELEVVHVLGLRGIREPYEIGTVGCLGGRIRGHVGPRGSDFGDGQGYLPDRDWPRGRG